MLSKCCCFWQKLILLLLTVSKKNRMNLSVSGCDLMALPLIAKSCNLEFMQINVHVLKRLKCSCCLIFLQIFLVEIYIVLKSQIHITCSRCLCIVLYTNNSFVAFVILSFGQCTKKNLHNFENFLFFTVVLNICI